MAHKKELNNTHENELEFHSSPEVLQSIINDIQEGKGTMKNYDLIS